MLPWLTGGVVGTQLDLQSRPVSPAATPESRLQSAPDLSQYHMQYFHLATFKSFGEPLEHSDCVIPMTFSEDDIATICQDILVRIWRVPENGVEE
ncbi:hypothetical protein M405DRAFT_526323 [Rhizopogon salebrosus TDB-379]|nr:hypothetical protein M405DRAFT_526323 [Rhizopogon salebrosus TDB-379]